jgi:hypothetical protein
MPNIFISYARRDRAEAERIVSELRKANLSGWMDASDLATGSSIASEVRNALNHASAVLVLLSPASLHSQWVQFEIGAAEALGKPIIPVLIEGGADLETEAPPILRQRQWVDARHRPPAEVAREIEAALK